MNINAVDLFCGVGGLTHGLEQAGINVVAGIDIVASSKFAYEANNNSKFIEADLKKVSSKKIDSLFPKNTDIKVLAGCAPCQPFSSYSYRYKGSDASINKMDLLDYFAKFIVDIKPDIVSMENVPQLSKEPIFMKFVRTLKHHNYSVCWKLVYAPSYGVPQNRKRLVLLASKSADIHLIDPPFNKDNLPDVFSAIGQLPELKAGEIDPHDALHHAAKLSKKNLERIKQSKPGGTWKDWDSRLLLACHKKSTGNTYRSVYGRMEWHKPSPTITTQFYGYGNGRFGHPVQNRAISLREGALLQTFPLNYKFFDTNKNKLSIRTISTQIGNAVPVKLAYYIGKSILKAVND
ncbi:DNA cytosine methyltransferase [Lactiplantibacillus plantarum]|uniref:DNA cytosine methyltransferase n=1 Tax=Lactiplantibacillus plantarum TaxID=1590 RepID=UPI0012F8E5BA|nr:DNA cytosine methyltransferase [Lactiplantibacillus plantarum]MCG0640761.1 DNA cytosine methyltransferase [Lactiplantibacillus plantarum]MCG0866378.1 DNA cytosine methyltransferase [Lactiplantibacillus plantarum]QGX68138.1 DNA (cytosine-5-)-methyltransferase [Lactiplantibacillus plantarum]